MPLWTICNTEGTSIHKPVEGAAAFVTAQRLANEREERVHVCRHERGNHVMYPVEPK